MQLTRHTDFAFRALIYLASMETKTVTIQQIADRFAIPKSHLMKVISQLVANGYVESIRGKQGGIKMAKPPADIRLNEIVILMENTLEPIDCEGQGCIIRQSCRLKYALRGARDSYLQSLAKYSLADMLNQPTVFTLHHTPQAQNSAV